MEDCLHFSGRARGAKKCCCNLLNFTLKMSQSQMSGKEARLTWLACFTLQSHRMAETAPFCSPKKKNQRKKHTRICLCLRTHWLHSTLTAESLQDGFEVVGVALAPYQAPCPSFNHPGTSGFPDTSLSEQET